MNIKHIAATLALLGTASFAVTGCGKKGGEGTEVPAEGGDKADGEGSCSGEKADGEGSCSGEGGEGSCSGEAGGEEAGGEEGGGEEAAEGEEAAPEA